MHILLTNDDGPPNPGSSPYLSTFVRILTSPPFNHTVSVVVPSQQRSWIGKAHLLPPSSFPIASQQPGHTKSTNEDISDCVTPSYYNPATGESSPTLPSPEQGEYWVTAPGTPATCVQLALFHHHLLFPHLKQKGGDSNNNSNSVNGDSSSTADGDSGAPDARKCPFDLIVSGPNFGRNTTAAFALSSGTIGGALEGAVCGLRAIALSYAFFTRKETDAMVEEASTLSVRLIERLWRDWEAAAAAAAPGGPQANGDGSSGVGPTEVPDLYSINVPLGEGVSKTPIYWTYMLRNQWNTGSLYKLVPPEEQVVSEGDGGGDAEKQQMQHRQAGPSFKWSPNFGDMWKTIDESPLGNDGRVIREKCVSVTPLRASFQNLFGVGGFTGEVKL